jgi:SHS2 domain-containing protein
MTAAPEGWEYFEVAADVGVRAWGPSLEACFRQCALGMFNLMVPLEAVSATETREVGAQGETPETLLVNWLNELIYLQDVEGFAVRDLTLSPVEGERLHARLVGEPIEPARHPRGVLVKAATFHELALERAPGRVSARVILDI